jgi:uncharacterized repeat protein (TIGR01451 family)
LCLLFIFSTQERYMNTIHQLSKTLRLAFVSAGLVLGLAQHSAYAAGTLSGTNIDNFAKLAYSVGGVAQNDICSSSAAAGNTTSTGSISAAACTSTSPGAVATTFKVDNKVNLTVTENAGLPTIVVPGATSAVTTFTVTNNGNTVQDYSLAVSNTVASGTTIFGSTTSLTDNFNPSTCTVFAETNGTAGYQAGADTAIYIDELAPDASRVVYAVCNIPVGQLNNDVAIVELTATTLSGGTTGTQGGALVVAANTQTGVEIVLADPATAASTDGTRPLQVAGDAKGTARDAYKVESAVLAVKKVVTPVCDPINGATAPKNIPGAAIQYAITITNTGAASATLTTITDTLDANLVLAASGVTGGAAAACTPSPVLTNGYGAVKSATTTTTYAAPGLAAESTTAGATAAGQNITINFATLATAGFAAPTAATLAAGASITVYFNAFIK